ncbi:MAG: metal-dependent hydrolase [Candidatus Dormibacteraceae bacterium]
MTGPTHRVLGAAVGLGVMAIHPLTVSLPPGLISDAGLHDAGTVLGAISLVVLGAFVARIPDWDLRVGLPHRGPSHSAIAVVASTVIAALLTIAIVPAAAVDVAAVTGASWLSHLVADSINPTPQALLWPWPGRQRPDWLPAVRESSPPGRLVEAVVVLAIVGVVGWRFLEALRS